jgi:two-component system, LuxR family, response regulator FixJ
MPAESQNKGAISFRGIPVSAGVCRGKILVLGRYDFEVRRFTSAEGFLANRDRENACCVVCDVRLPDMSVLELQAELQKRKSAMPVVLIAGHGDSSMAVSAVKAGSHDFLEKPFSPDRLIETIKGAVDKAHNRLAEDGSFNA